METTKSHVIDIYYKTLKQLRDIDNEKEHTHLDPMIVEISNDFPELPFRVGRRNGCLRRPGTWRQAARGLVGRRRSRAFQLRPLVHLIGLRKEAEIHNYMLPSQHCYPILYNIEINIIYIKIIPNSLVD
ncbi:unnamed protein product [Larinioides sclopetarius]|uniref:Uncharacterized protein n=1 Tax=Larinioides sclopetarius TaxID=280406 RepID=A0AAV1Z350_9ARAC